MRRTAWCTPVRRVKFVLEDESQQQIDDEDDANTDPDQHTGSELHVLRPSSLLFR
jgi:hypothetical protein